MEIFKLKSFQHGHFMTTRLLSSSYHVQEKNYIASRMPHHLKKRHHTFSFFLVSRKPHNLPLRLHCRSPSLTAASISLFIFFLSTATGSSSPAAWIHLYSVLGYWILAEAEASTNQNTRPGLIRYVVSHHYDGKTCRHNARVGADARAWKAFFRVVKNLREHILLAFT